MYDQKRQVKILISSDCQGRLEALMSKVNALQQKNQFDFILLNGQVCHSRSSSYFAALRQKLQKLPIPAYFIDNSDLSPVLQKLHFQGSQLAPSFQYLGSYGMTKILNINIAYFSAFGSWKSKEVKQQEIQRFIEMCKGKKIDILLTNQWSKEIRQVSKKQLAKTGDYVSKIAAQVNPHYHIAAGGGSFFRMTPYLNQNGFLSHFLSVAPFEENPKDKYLFGLTVKPGQQQVPSTSTNIIQNPYAKIMANQSTNKQLRLQVTGKRETANKNLSDAQSVVCFEGFPDWCQNSDITQFLERWGEIKTISVNRELFRGCRSGLVRFKETQSTSSCLASSEKVLFHTKRIKFTRKALKQTRRHEDCWFCKSKGDLSLIIYEGKYSYVSLQKGPLSRYHLQVVPFNHVQTTGRLQKVEVEEIEHIILALSRYFARQGYQIVEYERYLHLSEAINHAVVHLIPLKAANISRKFEELNVKDNLGFKILKEQFRKSQFYIKLKIGQKSFIKQIGKKQRVQADFMRIILSQLLDNPRLVNWKQCIRQQKDILSVKDELLAIIKQIGLIDSQRK